MICVYLAIALFSVGPQEVCVTVKATPRVHEPVLRQCGEAFRFRLFKDENDGQGVLYPLPLNLGPNEISVPNGYSNGSIDVEWLSEVPPSAKCYVFYETPIRVAGGATDLWFRPLENVARDLYENAADALRKRRYPRYDFLVARINDYADPENPDAPAIFEAASSLMLEMSRIIGRSARHEARYKALLGTMNIVACRRDQMFRYVDAYRAYLMTAYFGDGERPLDDSAVAQFNELRRELDDFLEQNWGRMASSDLIALATADRFGDNVAKAIPIAVETVDTLGVSEEWPNFREFSEGCKLVVDFALSTKLPADIRRENLLGS